VLHDLERPDQAQEAKLAQAEATLYGATVEPALQQTSAEVDLGFVPLLALHTRQGFYADPIYGGNRNRVGWDVIGFPGPASLAEVHTGRYSTLDYFADDRSTQWRRRRHRDQRSEARPGRRLHYRAGASGAAAAKVLTERRMRVVMLERGPWRTRETFGGDELANINRYNLWPDPLLNPRTVRDEVDGEFRTELFCPVPQMVGGGTVHWQGWLPRFTEEDFKLHSVVGDVPGTTLVDWPISYDDLESYYAQTEWAFGVSGRAGANRHESWRSKDYPCPPLPQSRCAQKFHEGCAKLGYNSFPTPQAALSRPFNGRPATVISAFAQQHGDPTGTRSSALNVFVPDALATGRLSLRSNSYVSEISVDEQGRAKGAVYSDEDGTTFEQEADVVILACGAVETARLLLLSKSSRFPNGLANGSDLVGRNVTFHEYSAAVGTFEDPIYAWAAVAT
jgi:choline dehydrogenase-like flavoprotein